MKATELDHLFDDGQDMSKHIDTSKAKRPNLEQRRINLDLQRI